MAISRSKVKIYITDAGVNPAALNTSTSLITGEIKSYTKSGGSNDVESDPVFGGYVDKEKPQEQFEMSFEVVPDLSANSDRWDAMIYGRTGNVYNSAAASPSDRCVYITAIDGTSFSKAWGFNNCNAITFDIEHNADDNQSGTLNFKFSPTTSSGVANFQTVGTSNANALNVLAAWSTLTSA